MHTEMFVRYMKNVITIRTCVNWFEQFENGDFGVSDKNTLDAPQLWKKMNCGKIEKNSKKR